MVKSKIADNLLANLTKQYYCISLHCPTVFSVWAFDKCSKYQFDFRIILISITILELWAVT